MSRGSRSRSRSNSPRRRGSPSSSPRRRRSPSPSSEPRRRRRRSRSRDSSEPRRRRRSPSPDGRRRRSASPAARHGAGRPPRRAEEPEALPPAGAIFRGRVVSIRPFGAFVALDGYRKHGLVHISQLAPRRVESVEEVLTEGQDVWVKVLPSEDPAKVSLSLRQVDQSTGADLGDEAPRRGRRNEAEAEDGAPRNADGSFAWGKLEPLERGGPEEEEEEAAPKQQPNFARTGLRRCGPRQPAHRSLSGACPHSRAAAQASSPRRATPSTASCSSPRSRRTPPSRQSTGGSTSSRAKRRAEESRACARSSRVQPHRALESTRAGRAYSDGSTASGQALEPYHIHRQSSYLLGRERRVVDLPLDHPSCSVCSLCPCPLLARPPRPSPVPPHPSRPARPPRPPEAGRAAPWVEPQLRPAAPQGQHAVLQFRLTAKSDTGKLVRPYLMDLGGESPQLPSTVHLPSPPRMSRLRTERDPPPSRQAPPTAPSSTARRSSPRSTSSCCRRMCYGSATPRAST